ncbi:MAG TPA: hypothetical protein VN969_07990 [Streptosporangiaceae bacterium]|nr:hypothetical protein [Streptosporangiaceae bacterium]
MIGRKKFGVLAAGVVVAAGTAFGVSGIVSGTAHAQGTGSFSVTSVNTYQTTVAGLQESGWQTVFSVTCTQGDGGYIKTAVTQLYTYSGTSPAINCTGSPQTVDVVIQPSASGTYPFAPGSVSVNAVLFAGPVGFGGAYDPSPMAGFANQPAVVN